MMTRFLKNPSAAICAASLAFAGAFAGQAQTTERLSVHFDGTEGNSDSGVGRSTISADGRYVAFSSFASNLVDVDTNNDADVFVRDRDTGENTIVSVSSSGVQGNKDSGNFGPTSAGIGMSADGRYVVFASDANNLVDDDNNNRADIFVHDRDTGETTIVSVSSAGDFGDGHNNAPSISDDGQHVCFNSRATNLVTGDTNNGWDSFVHHRQTGITERASVTSSEVQSSGDTFMNGTSISTDGRYVVFDSEAANLVTGDNNNDRDVFVRDTVAGTTTRVSVDSNGVEGNNDSQDATISGDGRYIVFMSAASNLAEGGPLGTEIYRHDRDTGETIRVAVDNKGNPGDSHSETCSMSSDGRYVGFISLASNLVPDDNNGSHDAFIHDVQEGTTARVSIATDGTESNGEVFWYSISISDDGRFIVFDSTADNLVDGDKNFWTDAFLHDRGPGGFVLADLAACSITFGSTDNGPCDTGNLAADDDVDQILRSQFGFSAFERNLTEIQIDGNASSGTTMATIDTRDSTDTTNVVAKVKARNYVSNSIQDVGIYNVSFPAGEDTPHSTPVGSADFVDANGDIEVLLRYVAPATFTPLGFTAGLDQVEVGIN